MIDIAKHKWKFFISISIVGLIIDWYTKHLAATKLTPYHAVSVIGEILEFQLTFNKGFIFGFDPRGYFPNFPVNPVFIVLSIFAVTLLIVYYMNIDSRAKLSFWAISIIMPGALGNALDRIVRPGTGVVDFIKFDFNFFPFNPWPLFNMADVYITVGVSMVIFDMLFLEGKRREQDKAAMLQTALPAQPDNEVDDAPTVVE